jgi:probable rRNA maturation factor
LNQIKVNNSVRFKSKALLHEWAVCLYDIARFEGELSVNVVGEDEMIDLNKRFYKGAYVTDVLTFPMDDKDILGDIVICWSQIKKNARANQLLLRHELCKIIVHSFVHLLGYDHQNLEDESTMLKKERELFDRLRLKRQSITWDFV